VGIDSKQIELFFEAISQKLYSKKHQEDWLAIDGKFLKNTLINHESDKQNMLIMVSAFSQGTKLVINSASWESKNSSETNQVRYMIGNCGLSNKVFTLDALHCSKETTQAIIDSKNDYLVTVKGNQIKLYNLLKTLAKIQKPLTVNQTKDNSHGRYVIRNVAVFDGQHIYHENYPHLKSFIKVERSGFRGNKESNQILYYISSLKLTAQTFAEKIKEHWLIENCLHWVKDVIFREDKSRIKGMEVAGKLSLLITLTMNIYRSLGFLSITEGKSWLRKNWEKIFSIP
jgi:predicted transposase YbfD/YdcC